MSTILLTGAGGAAIPDLIRHLKGLGHRVLTCDMNSQAPGLYLGDVGFVVPPATDPDFFYATLNLCVKRVVDVLIPLVDEELTAICVTQQLRTTLKLAPNRQFIKTCLDKWTLMQNLRRMDDVRRPYTSFFTAYEMSLIRYPAIVKPRMGRGSRGVCVIRNQGELIQNLTDGKLRFSENLIAQEYIEGPEYTVSVVCDQLNTVHAVVPKEIIRKEGQTWLAVTRKNAKIDTVCRRIAEVLNPCGPFNVQLRLRDGEPYVFEINPRFSGTVNLTIQAGCDEVGGLIELALGRPYTFGEWREGVVLVRQTHDMVMDEAEFLGQAPRRWNA